MFDADRDWDYLVDRILLLLGRDGASQALETFEPEGMEAALLRSREALTIPSASMRDLVQRDPLGLVLSLRSRFVGNKGFSQFDPTAEGYVSSDGRSRMVIAKPTGPAFDADFCAELLAELAAVERRVLSELESDELAFVGDEAPPPIGIELAGGYRATYEAENLIRGEMKLNALVSLVLLLSVIFVVFRSYWILMCAATTLGLAGLMTMVAVGLARGDLLAAASGGSGDALRPRHRRYHVALRALFGRACPGRGRGDRHEKLEHDGLECSARLHYQRGDVRRADVD